MREIKFRGIRKDNGEWAYGYYYAWHSKEEPNKLITYIHMILYDDEGCKILDEQCEVIPESVGQYTGLKDVNEIEIYEGDILKAFHGDDARVCEVYYKDAEWKVRYPPHKFDGSFLWFMHIGYTIRAEIIGNIHQKPELINIDKVKKE